MEEKDTHVQLVMEQPEAVDDDDTISVAAVRFVRWRRDNLKVVENCYHIMLSLITPFAFSLLISTQGLLLFRQKNRH